MSGYVYFVSVDNEWPVKIGWAANPWYRVTTLQTGHPKRLVLFAWMLAHRYEEAELHRRFAKHRIRGEWFGPGQEVKSFIYGNPRVEFAPEETE